MVPYILFVFETGSLLDMEFIKYATLVATEPICLALSPSAGNSSVFDHTRVLCFVLFCFVF